MNSKLLVASFACTILLASCHNSADLEKIEAQARANDSITALLNEKTLTLTQIADAIADIQTRVDDIKEKQGIVSINSANPEVPVAQLKSDIDAIAEEMEKNKKTIQSLRYSLSKTKSQSDEYKKIIDALQAQVDRQTAEIAELNAELEKRNIKIQSLEEVVASTSEELETTKTSLTATTAAKEAAESTVKKQKTVYYICDTKENLIAANVLDASGNVIATGSESAFTEIDKTTQFTINLASNGKKFKVLSKQAENRKYKKSYVLNQDTKTIKIVNSGIFWGADKCLIVEITKTE